MLISEEYYHAEQYQKNYVEALTFLEKSLKYPIDKNLVLAASFWTAETFSKGGKYNESITYYARIFENDPLKSVDPNVGCTFYRGQ